MNLTNLAVRNAKPQAAPYKLFDGKGLFLIVRPNGSKWWRFKYRFDGKEKLLSLGTYPEISLADARESRDLSRQKVAKGIDPSIQRQLAKQSKVKDAQSTFRFVAEEWMARNSHVWSSGHSERIRSRLKRLVLPKIGDKQIEMVSVQDILGFIRPIEDEEKFETAHRVLNVCSQIFRYGVQTGRLTRDPCPDLRGALKPAKTKHFAAITDPKEVPELLAKLSAYSGSIPVKAALNLAPHVFVRPGELRTAKWEDIDLKIREWRFWIGKTGIAHIVPLSSVSAEILESLHSLTGNSLYVFPNARSNDRPMSNNAVLAALRSLGIPKEKMSGHGFRAMARTLLEEVLEFRPDLVEQQLAHTVRDPLGRAYNRTTHLEKRREMMEAWSNYLTKLSTLPDPDQNTPLK